MTPLLHDDQLFACPAQNELLAVGNSDMPMVRLARSTTCRGQHGGSSPWLSRETVSGLAASVGFTWRGIAGVPTRVLLLGDVVATARVTAG